MKYERIKKNIKLQSELNKSNEEDEDYDFLQHIFPQLIYLVKNEIGHNPTDLKVQKLMHHCAFL